MSLQSELAVERPTEIPKVNAKPDWKVAVKRAVAKFSRDQCTDVAAMLTYYSMLALFPGLVAVVSLIGVFNIKPDVIIEIVAGVTSKPVYDSVFDTPRKILESFSGSSGAGLALVVGVLGALWSASGYVGGFGRAMNRIYDIGEGRPIWKLRPWLYLVTAVEAVMIVLVLIAFVFSGSVAQEVGKQIGLGEEAVTAWNIAKWPFVVLIVILIICLLLWATPNIRKPRRLFLSWGAAVGFVVWVLASAGFGLYLTLTGGSSYNKTYGAFAGVVMFLLWLWITNLALLFGAELDAELERTRQLRSGLPAEDMILLPARDESGLDKQEAKHDQVLQDAHDLRLASGPVDHADGRAASRPQTRVEPALALTAGGRNERNAPAMAAAPDRQSAPKPPSVRLREQAAGQPYDAARDREIVALARQERRDAALVDAGQQRMVRLRLEAQEAEAAKAQREAERAAEAERKALESHVTREQRWAQVDEVRSRFAPGPSVERDAVNADRKARRAAYDATQAEQAARPPAPKPPKVNKHAEPTAAQLQIEAERAQRRTAWEREHPAYAEPLQFRRDRRASS